MCMYRVAGRRVRETLGTTATIPKVEDARDLARASMQKAQAGTHPVEERQELAAAADVQLACAYSRVPDLPRVYVQDRLRQLSEQVMSLLDQGGQAYICGATGMADGVRTALVELRQELRREDPEAAHQWMRQLTADRRLLVDVWASG